MEITFVAPTDNSSPWDWAAAAVHRGSTKRIFPQVKKTPALNWVLTPSDFIVTQYKSEAQELGNKHRALPQELSTFNMENYRTSTRWWFFLHSCTSSRSTEAVTGCQEAISFMLSMEDGLQEAEP